jgi:hypothetical protein
MGLMQRPVGLKILPAIAHLMIAINARRARSLDQ